MCPERALLQFSTLACCARQQLLGDRHNNGPVLPSEVPVGRRQLRLFPTRNPELYHLSILVNLTNYLASRLAKPPPPPPPEPSSSTGGPATTPPSSNKKPKSKAKSIPNGPNGKASTPATIQVQIDGSATLNKSATSADRTCQPTRQRLRRRTVMDL